jgi:hypothetical protein
LAHRLLSLDVVMNVLSVTRTVGVLAIALSSLGVACGSEKADGPRGTGSTALCTPSRQTRCTCNNGLVAGFGTCNDDGTAVVEGSCNCEKGEPADRETSSQEPKETGSAPELPPSSPPSTPPPPLPAPGGGPTAAERCDDLGATSVPVLLANANGWTATFSTDLSSARSDTVSSFTLADGPDRVVRLRSDLSGTARITVLGSVRDATKNTDLVLYARATCTSPSEIAKGVATESLIDQFPYLEVPIVAGEDVYLFVDSRKNTGLSVVNFKAELP